MRHHLLRIIIMVSLLLPARVSFAQDEASALEYKVKAAVLFNFAKYIKWPAKVFTSDTQPVQVCIAGKDPFGDLFTSDQAPKEAQNRPFKVKTMEVDAVAKDGTSCQILFWQLEDKEKIHGVLSKLHEAGVLTVANEESDESLISFVIENGKVRFQIRRKAAEALGFELSSQLLKLAIVEDD